MRIYRCKIELKEATFFASREVNALFQTEAVIGNYALAYALGLCSAPYSGDKRPRYQEDLSVVAERGIYVTPATLDNPPRFVFAQFNGLSEGYFSAMANNALAVPGTGQYAERDGNHWYIRDSESLRRRVSPANFPQIGRIRLLAAETLATFYVTSQEPLVLPSYIRLGKFMSKAKVTAYEMRWQEIEDSEESIPFYLNPTDLPQDITLRVFDVLSIRPAPLIRNVTLTGRLYRLQDNATSKDVYLPVGMRFLNRL